MTFKNPIKKQGQLGDGGNFIRMNFNQAGEAARAGLYYESPIVERNGAHFFYSKFIKAESVEEYPEYRTWDGFIASIFEDPDYQIKFNLTTDSNGRIVADSAGNGIDFAIEAEPEEGFSLRFGRPIGAAVTRRLNCDLKGWFWIAFYLNPEDPALSKFYMNGMDCTILGGEEQQTIGYVPATAGTILHSLRSRRDVDNLASAFLHGSEWFCSAANGSVIGQPEFLDEFINPNGTAKDLGSGTVQGIVPHFYFSGRSGADINEVDGRRWTKIGDPERFSLYATETDELSFYGDPTRSYFACLVSSGQIYSRIKTQSPISTGSRLFMSFFVKNEGLTDNVTNWRYSMGLDNDAYFYIDIRGIFSSDFGFMARITGAVGVTYDAEGQINDGTWQYGSVYLDIDAEESTFIRNGAVSTLIRNEGTGGTQGSDPTISDFMGLLNTSKNTKTSNFIVYGQAEIDANPQIDWDSPTLFENFMDGAGRPIDIGIDGSGALGVLPRIYLNGALQVGASGNTAARTAIQRQQDNYSASDPSIAVADTRSYEEDIVVTIVLGAQSE